MEQQTLFDIEPSHAQAPACAASGGPSQVTATWGLLGDLDEVQSRAVTHRGGALLVLGGPGTGKTTTVVEVAVGRLGSGSGCEPGRVLVLAASREAAAGLRAAIGHRIGGGALPVVSTFHAFALAALRAYGPREESLPPLRLLTAGEQESRLRELLEAAVAAGRVRWPAELSGALGTRGIASAARALIARARGLGLDGPGLARLGRRHGVSAWEALGGFLEEYLDILGFEAVIDYQELVYQVMVLAHQPRAGAPLRAQYDLIVADDFQDIEPAQVATLAALSRAGTDFVAVGDPDQTIYGFRGSAVSGISDFASRFARGPVPAPVLVLGRARRCGTAIAAAARRILAPTSLAPMPAQTLRQLRAPRPSEVARGDVSAEVYPSAAAQAAGIADRLVRAHAEGLDWSQMAVLVRTPSGVLDQLRRALAAARVPVALRAGERPLRDQPAVGALLALLSAAATEASNGAGDLLLEVGGMESDPAQLLCGPVGRLDRASVRMLGEWLARAAAPGATQSCELGQSETPPSGQGGASPPTGAISITDASSTAASITAASITDASITDASIADATNGREWLSWAIRRPDLAVESLDRVSGVGRHPCSPEQTQTQHRNPDTLNIQSLDIQSLDIQSLDTQSLDNQFLDTQFLGTDALDTQVLHTRSLDTQVLHTRSLDTQVLHSQSLNTQVPHTQCWDCQRCGVRPSDTDPLVEPAWQGVSSGAELADEVRRWLAGLSRVGKALQAGRDVLAGGGRPAEALWAIWASSDWPDRLRARALRAGPSGLLADADLDAVIGLFEFAARMPPQVRGPLGAQSLVADVASQEVPIDLRAGHHPQRDAVTLASAHAGRGGSWQLVVLAGVQEGVWPDARPHSQLLQTDQLEPDRMGEPTSIAQTVAGERRLFYTACTRASQQLVVTAVQDATARPSRFLSELGVPVTTRLDARLPSVSQAGVISRLRALCASSDPHVAQGARERLARLAQLRDASGQPLMPLADPANWWFAHPISGDRQNLDRPQEPGAPIVLSPSTVAAVSQCPLRWYLDRRCGASPPPGPAVGVGLLVHEAAHSLCLSAEGPAHSREQILANLEQFVSQGWGRIRFPAGYLELLERRRVSQMLEVLVDWHLKAAGRPAASEHRFDVALTTGGHRVRLVGAIDRIDADGAGGLCLVDYKTGKNPVSKQAAVRDPQLAAYQVAVRHGALGPLGAPESTAGARLVYLAHAQAADGLPTVREQPALPPGPGWAQEMLGQVASVIAEGRWVARVSPACQNCNFEQLCPAWGVSDDEEP